MTIESVKDKHGHDVRVGDEIMYITSSGHVPQINYAVVDEFKEVERPGWSNDASFAYSYPYGCKIRVKKPVDATESTWYTPRDWALLERAPIFKRGEVL